jgi:hypothetical protein
MGRGQQAIRRHFSTSYSSRSSVVVGGWSGPRRLEMFCTIPWPGRAVPTRLYPNTRSQRSLCSLRSPNPSRRSRNLSLCAKRHDPPKGTRIPVRSAYALQQRLRVILHGSCLQRGSNVEAVRYPLRGRIASRGPIRRIPACWKIAAKLAVHAKRIFGQWIIRSVAILGYEIVDPSCPH